VFASDAQALAAAKAAYEGYNAVSDQIAHDGGRNPGRIAKWVSKSWLPTELKGLRSLQNSGEHLVGYTTFRSFTLQTRTQDVRGTTQVGTYACVDVSKTKLRDSSNRNVTPAGRTLILPLELRFESVTAWSTSLVLTESQAWTGQDFCL
jgi:hypothetical protein